MRLPMRRALRVLEGMVRGFEFGFSAGWRFLLCESRRAFVAGVFRGADGGTRGRSRFILSQNVTGRDILPLRVRLFSGSFLRLRAAFPLMIDRLRTVLAVKGSLRRAKCRRALDCSGPFSAHPGMRGKAASGIPCGVNVRDSPENIVEDYIKSQYHVSPCSKSTDRSR